MNRAILVKSCQRFRARADACIRTWCFELWDSGDVDIEILAPSSQLLQFWSLSQGVEIDDGYQSNSLKLREGIRHFLERKAFTHLFICDDDTFVHPKRWLAHEPTGDFECRLFHPKNDREKKMNDGRPWAHGGGGWWMSRRMCELYVQHVTERKSCDDILAARVAQEHGIEIVDRPDLYGPDRYTGEGGVRVSAENSLITCHHVQPAEMVRLWEATREIC